MPEDPPRQPVSAAAPFDRKDADVILSSSDNVHFRVHRAILMIASPFFDSMFRLPQPPDARDDIPVVHVTEDSYTLDVLLRMCYPVARPAMSLGLVSSALEAANKYDMGIIKASLKGDLRRYISSYPLHVFVVACRLEDENIATAAAFELGKITECNTLPPFEDVFGEVPAGCYHRLLQYLQGRMDTSLSKQSAVVAGISFIRRRADKPVGRGVSHSDFRWGAPAHVEGHHDSSLICYRTGVAGRAQFPTRSKFRICERAGPVDFPRRRR